MARSTIVQKFVHVHRNSGVESSRKFETLRRLDEHNAVVRDLCVCIAGRMDNILVDVYDLVDVHMGLEANS